MVSGSSYVLVNMELFQAKDHYILQSGDNALWCSRKDGSMAVRPGNSYITFLYTVHVFNVSVFTVYIVAISCA